MATALSEPQVTRRRLGRILLGLCLGCTGLLTLGLTLLPDILALERVQRVLVRHVEAALPHRVTIGAVRLQLFPGLEVTLDDVIVDSSPGWEHSPFLHIGTLSLQVAPLALLRGPAAITKMIVRDAALVIERDPQGQLNVDDLAAFCPGRAQHPAAERHKARAVEAKPPAVKAPARWPAPDVALEGVTVRFVDRLGVPGGAVTTIVRDVRGHLRDFSCSTPIPFDVTATALTDGHHNLRLQGRISPIPAPMAIGEAHIEADLQATDLLLRRLSSYLSPRARFPLEEGRMGAGLKVQGRIGGHLRIAGALSLVAASWRDPMGGVAAVPLPMLVSTQQTILDLANASIQIAEAQLDLFGLHATLTGAVADVHTSPRFDLQLATTTFRPGDLLPQIPLLASIIPAPAELQGRAQLQAAVAGTPHALRADVHIAVNEVALKTGGIHMEMATTHVSLTAHLAESHPPQIHFDLRTHHLVVDQREANAPLPTATPPPGSTPRAPQAHTKLPLVTLNGTVKIAEGRLHRLQFRELTADVALVQGHLTTTHQATLYGGSYRGTAQVKLARREPIYTLNARVVGVQLGAAMRPWTSGNTVRQGVLTAQSKVSGRGWTWLRLRHTLRGDGHATITKLKTRPADPRHVRTRKITIISPLGNMTRRIRVQHESIHTVRASLHMRQGRIFSDDLQLWGEDVAIWAKGYLGLDRSVTCDGTLALYGERANAQGILAKLFLRDAHDRILYPFTIKGTTSDPQIVVNVKDLIGQAVDGLTEIPK